MHISDYISGEYIRIEPNIRLNIRDWGKGKTIVFIPGWPLGQEMFEYQFTALSRQGFRCIGITMRGFGRSSKPWGEYNYDVFAEDIEKVLDALNLHDITLAGHSMGGAIALHYTANHKSRRVSRLALFGAATPSFTKRPGFPYGLEPAAVDDLITLCETDRAKLGDNFGKIFFRSEKAVSPKLAEWFHDMGMEASPLAVAACLVALRDTDLRGDMALIKVPTAIFHSSQDKICPFELAEATAAGIKGSKLIRFENSGHGLFYEEKDKFNQELMDFIG
jgi:pimeloyl-ACP methyl ester carboxylesterase